MTVDAMRAWRTPGDGSLHQVELPVPVPGAGEVLVKVEACGVCRTDLHVIDGDLTPHCPAVVPGHEVVGEVVASEGEVGDVRIGDRVGIAWLRSMCRVCRWCCGGLEQNVVGHFGRGFCLVRVDDLAAVRGTDLTIDRAKFWTSYVVTPPGLALCV